MLYAYQAGIKPDEFYSYTLAEIIRMITAHRLNEYNADFRARMIGYWALLPHRKEGVELDIYELWPLRFDPSKKELERLNQEKLKGEQAGLLELLNKAEQERKLYEEQMKEKNG